MGGIVTPEDVVERLARWVASADATRAVLAEWHDTTEAHVEHAMPRRRVELVENEGPRRTWTLYEGPTQVGHVRLRERQPHGRPSALVSEWHIETSRGIAREALGLDEPPRSGQTDPG